MRRREFVSLIGLLSYGRPSTIRPPRMLGLTVPPTLLTTADEVIE